MPIPDFDGILNVLPPHLGDPTKPSDLSPYECTTSELCDRFASSPERKIILDGFLAFRKELLAAGIQGFQWLDGSFLENIEILEARSPADIDVITFVSIPASPADLVLAISNLNPKLLDRATNKSEFHVNHFMVPLGSPAHLVVDLTRYWCGLFSHRRDRTWKGMLLTKLIDKAEDDQARIVLGSKP